MLMMSVLAVRCECGIKCFNMNSRERHLLRHLLPFICFGLRAHVFSRVLNPSDEAVFEKVLQAWPGLGVFRLAC